MDTESMLEGERETDWDDGEKTRQRGRAGKPADTRCVLWILASHSFGRIQHTDNTSTTKLSSSVKCDGATVLSIKLYLHCTFNTQYKTE